MNAKQPVKALGKDDERWQGEGNIRAPRAHSRHHASRREQAATNFGGDGGGGSDVPLEEHAGVELHVRIFGVEYSTTTLLWITPREGSQG